MPFEDTIKKLVAEHLNISRTEVLAVEMINAVGYSGTVLNNIIGLIAQNDFESLEDDDLNESDNPDTLSIYKATLLNRAYMAIIFEPFELHNNMRILHVTEMENVELANNLIAQ